MPSTSSSWILARVLPTGNYMYRPQAVWDSTSHPSYVLLYIISIAKSAIPTTALSRASGEAQLSKVMAESIPARGPKRTGHGGDKAKQAPHTQKETKRGRGNKLAARRHRTPLTPSVFQNRQRRGLGVMRLRDFGRFAELGGPVGPETESIFFRAPRHREATLQLSRATTCGPRCVQRQTTPSG